MPAVIGWQVYSVGLVVSRDDNKAYVEYFVLAQVLFIDRQHIRRCRQERFQVLIKLEAVDVAQIVGLVDAQDERFQETVKASDQRNGRYLFEIPRTYAALDRLQHGVLADALQSAPHDTVVALVLRLLLPVRQSFIIVSGFVRTSLLH